MGTWNAEAALEAPPAHVLSLLTEPRSCARWSPVPFDLDGMTERRLATGTRARVGGRLVGRRVDFDVEILRADERGLELRAQGPLKIEARYDARRSGDSTLLNAAVSVKPGPGLVGRLTARVAEGLLAAGALEQVMRRIAGELAFSAGGVPSG